MEEIITDADLRKAAVARVGPQDAASKVLQRLPKLVTVPVSGPYLAKQSGVVKLNTSALLQKSLAKKQSAAPRPVFDLAKAKKEALTTKESNAGDRWFNMPKTEVTPSIKRDLQLLKLRNVLDPKRHYRREDSKEFPKYFQTGTVIEGPTEFFSSRLTRKQRKQTLADEILADAATKNYFKRKYDEIQASKTSGGKNHYKKVKKRRTRGY
ncbi:Fcf2 pre-rRNA processing-domain-containing protein [Limtongia smithiae]|uniref:Fcf2 pre-rRNA processing-domain-containing protein n=1 Tax=Limtongia smithiae TaxID=1125753 RepID=UPI0034CE36BA